MYDGRKKTARGGCPPIFRDANLDPCFSGAEKA